MASLVRIAEILLTRNEFSFNAYSYNQIIGAPQGAIPSPEICDIAIFHHISKIMDRFSDRFEMTSSSYIMAMRKMPFDILILLTALTTY